MNIEKLAAELPPLIGEGWEGSIDSYSRGFRQIAWVRHAITGRGLVIELFDNDRLSVHGEYPDDYSYYTDRTKGITMAATTGQAGALISTK